jgi:hypothetical protein
MARRKPTPRATGRKAGGRRSPAARTRRRSARSRPASARAAGKKKSAAARKTTKKAAKKKASKKAASRRAVGPAAKKAAGRKVAARRRDAVSRGRVPGGRPVKASRKEERGRSTPRSGRPRVRHEPPIRGEAPVVPGPPSSLDLDQHGSAARSGREEYQEHLRAHTATGPVMTAGDVDANWETAYDSGDEAPGGDHPTPDQDVVEEIGRAIGLEYQDNEELKAADKVEERDRHRWELDPASSEDYQERRRQERRRE